MKRYAALMALALTGCSDEPPAIHKWDSMLTSEWSDDKAYQFVISNPPNGQQALVELVSGYLKNSPPPGFWNDEYGATFYRESRVTPANEKERPESNWWDQSWDVPYIKFKPIDNQEIAAARYMKDTKTLRIFLEGEYRHTCENRTDGIVDVQLDGSHEPTCD